MASTVGPTAHDIASLVIGAKLHECTGLRLP